MSTPFQNRLVGTIIVAAVAIIILPDLLDGNKKTYQDEFEKIPPPPKVEFVKNTLSFPEDKIVKVTNEILSDETALDDDVSSAEQTIKYTVETENEPRLNNASATKEDEKVLTAQAAEDILPEKSVLQQAWVVQLGSFRHKKNVAQLLLKLKDNGYTAFTKPIKTKNGPLIKVFIGPELIKNSLIKKIPALKKLTGVEGKIARFYPTK
ncbi:SPOR domain-containing protein [Colwellia hornerae]|uniref:DedD protein n=1 Tax=Colwellia hornerae TaxID=89402 RepID=A0A5C6Q512_9GAMM|nr:SPOR domain-containing protein [Colwellia hornerae]TWX48341.1 dedD protein [Colwellia hornerae]TWX54920.1 dedD protein [Colwellia hornerae]TWX63870.1 dedD protein [Colwellia hornerae]